MTPNLENDREDIFYHMDPQHTPNLAQDVLLALSGITVCLQVTTSGTPLPCICLLVAVRPFCLPHCPVGNCPLELAQCAFSVPQQSSLSTWGLP